MTKKTSTTHRSAVTGRKITKAQAEAKPRESIAETRKSGGKKR